ncbi:hypothetical protein GWI33_004487 [Rhynchophorus ferrugineus]|uniref:Rhodanese domain-containing protein n=1 Tax=Rhynchophorus ferrugineus TaxID=354439 RepID=A0A834IIL7_RHYFE|nr:hypothetical protein GWI33_004487 [Rhynchophorus ferrugineus]
MYNFPNICTYIKSNNGNIVHMRFFSNTAEINYIVDFNEVKKLKNNKEAVLIDVRKPEELAEHGSIPGSINIPLDDIEKSLKDLSEKDFLKKYGIPKPTPDSPIIFSCMKGNRSTKAHTLAQTLGYKNAKNYTGGWTDWAEKNKK